MALLANEFSTKTKVEPLLNVLVPYMLLCLLLQVEVVDPVSEMAPKQ